MAALGFVSSDKSQSIGAESAQANPATNFFVSSTGSKTANLGGLSGADKTCQGSAVGLGNKTWRAYLSVGLGPGGDPAGRYSFWNSSHDNGSCADTGPRGGGGRIYCFAAK